MSFLVFEGLDGAGKSTLIKSLEDHLVNLGHSVEVTREPGGTELGEELRQILLRKDGEAPCPKAELLLYQAIRAQHVENKIAPCLERGTWVLCDRFTASSLAFQAGGRQLEPEPVTWLNNYSTGNLQPELFVLLDLATEVSQERLHGREGGAENLDRFEAEAQDFHGRVRHYYLKLAKENPDKWLVLDAQKDKESLFQELLSVLGGSQLLNLIEQAKTKGKLAPSLLFVGSPQVDKKGKALDLVYAYLEGRRDLGHQSLLIIEPEKQVIKIEKARQAIDFFSMKSLSKKRFIIIDQAECLNLQASNAMLKIIEEPPEDSHFILISSYPSRLLPTIRSRCQVWRFTDFKLDSHVADLQTDEGTEMRGLALHFLESVFSSGKMILREELLEVAKSKEKYSLFIKMLMQILRDMEIYGHSPDQIIHEDKAEALKKLASIWTSNQVSTCFNFLLELETATKKNWDLGLALESFVYKCQDLKMESLH